MLLQGTNAHAILSKTHSPQRPQASSQTLWQRERFWFTVAAHALLLRSAPGGSAQSGIITFQAPLAGPHLAFLNDHRIQDRGLFPGAAMFETAGAAMRTLQQQQQLPSAAALVVPVLAAVTIAQPLVMTVGQMQTLLCTVNLLEGKVSIASVSHSPQLLHMTSMAGKPFCAARPSVIAESAVLEEGSRCGLGALGACLLIEIQVFCPST